MNLAPHLAFCEKKLNSLQTRQKIQLYFIPVCLMVFVVYNYIDFNKGLSSKPVTELTRNELNFYDFLTQLQEFSLNKGLSIINIKQNSMSVSLEAQGDFIELMRLLIFCETYESINNIESLKLTIKENTLHLLLTFSFAQYRYDAFEPNKKSPLKSLLNPFTLKVANAIEPLSIKLYAIVNNEVLINDTWLKEGEMYLDYEVYEIKTHSVMVKKTTNEYEELHLIKE